MLLNQTDSDLHVSGLIRVHPQLSVFEHKQFNIGLGFKQQILIDFHSDKFALGLQDFSAGSASPREAALDLKLPRDPRLAFRVPFLPKKKQPKSHHTSPSPQTADHPTHPADR